MKLKPILKNVGKINLILFLAYFQGHTNITKEKPKIKKYYPLHCGKINTCSFIKFVTLAPYFVAEKHGISFEEIENMDSLGYTQKVTIGVAPDIHNKSASRFITKGDTIINGGAFIFAKTKNKNEVIFGYSHRAQQMPIEELDFGQVLWMRMNSDTASFEKVCVESDKEIMQASMYGCE